MRAEHVARLLLIVSTVGLPLAVLLGRRGSSEALPQRTIEIRGTMPEAGGWSPGELTVRVDEPLHLRLTSDDVMHGFAVGAFPMAPIDVKPGEVAETILTFSRPGRYVYYCTRWCGVNHWRMRGTIEVTGAAGGPGAAPEPGVPPTPLYLSLNLDLDAPHSAEVVPVERPSAERGAGLGIRLPPEYATTAHDRRRSPVETWKTLRADSVTADLSDRAVWDLVALIRRRNSTAETLETGRKLYASNCAACHGESGAGDGVMASQLEADSLAEFGHVTTTPADFSDATSMLGASPALLQGKIVRGGMGTGMPYWGPVFTEEETWAIVDYLWTFQFSLGDGVADEEKAAAPYPRTAETAERKIDP